MSSAPTSMFTYEQIEEIAKFLSNIDSTPCKIGIICGTGLGGLADVIENRQVVEYKDIPNFPVSTVPGHAGQLVFGDLQSKHVICMKGRFHMYEGYHMSQLTLPVRVMKLLGVEVLIVTNAAGGLNRSYKVGDMMMLKDHVFFPALAGNNPLVGPNDSRWGTRFPPSSGIYTEELRTLARQAANELGLEKYLREGVYAMNGGPSFESIAECKLFATLGVDAVGMSTCPEAVVAGHCGMRVFGMSLVTNECVIDYDDKRSPNHSEVLQTGDERAKDIQSFIIKLVSLIQ